MKQILIATSLALFATFLVACAEDKAPAPAEKEGSTAISIDTGEGGFSYKSEDGGESTSVTIDADDSKGKK